LIIHQQNQLVRSRSNTTQETERKGRSPRFARDDGMIVPVCDRAREMTASLHVKMDAYDEKLCSGWSPAQSCV